jgi:hypothetical protein
MQFTIYGQGNAPICLTDKNKYAFFYNVDVEELNFAILRSQIFWN